ncbi:hypothetical protein AKJ09_07779 [Labilithrix luteola]|uniref:Outer membrane lipoprotein BamD-like domain-containing protein n=1 Tax=Labilithrix luteola TaxID=1391654 RepID=A0A0K1Q5L3_9BACT|nr:hypothetical protein [Labilithrix luteola]AKV01116.1 hypothetical protein AKJ09_07779 [Labilithrix luteola]
MKPSDPERALEALFRAGRGDPTTTDLARLESRLSPYLVAPPARKSSGIGSTALKSIILLVGFSVFSPSQVYEGPALPTMVAASAVTAPDVPSAGDRLREAPVPSTEASISVTDLPNARAVPTLKATTAPAKASEIGSFGGGVVGTPDTSRAANALSEGAGAPQAPEESEASFLRRAQTTLNADPASALAMLREHPTRFPRGILVQERDVMIIDSLVRLGRMDEARARARTFTATYPSSAHASRINSIVSNVSNVSNAKERTP